MTPPQTNGHLYGHVPSNAEVDPRGLEARIVALLFLAPDGLTLEQLASLAESDTGAIDAACQRLREAPPVGLAVLRHEGQVALTTDPRLAGVVERYLAAPPPARLSRAALEVLAVIAYRQPVTRGDIESIRGVNSDSAVATLLARGLIAEAGRRESAGRPALLRTTPEMLTYLGIRSIDELPHVEGLPRLAPPTEDSSARSVPEAGDASAPESR